MTPLSALLGLLQVQTIDQSQGDEADAVVLSLVLAYTLPEAPVDTQSEPQDIAGELDLSWALSSKWKHEATPTDYMQLRNRANVAISRTRYHLTVLASESAHFCMKGRNGREVSLWGRLLDTHLQDEPVFEGCAHNVLGGEWLLAAQVRPDRCCCGSPICACVCRTLLWLRLMGATDGMHTVVP